MWIGDEPAETGPAMPLPIDGVLDLHTFRPQDVGGIVRDYLAECRARGILEVRIIHGKGAGHLRRGVRALLERLAEVESFIEASALYGGSGATIVTLRPGAVRPDGDASNP